jgi:hypothetical protein
MPDAPKDITLDEVRERVRQSGLPIPEARLEMVRGFLVNALRPLRQLDTRAVRTLEPAPTFDAAAEEARHGR